MLKIHRPVEEVAHAVATSSYIFFTLQHRVEISMGAFTPYPDAFVVPARNRRAVARPPP